MKHSQIEIKPEFIVLIFAYFFLMFAALCLQLINAQDWASLNRLDIEHFKLWQLLTAHLIHANWMHFSMNMIGMALCFLVFLKDVSARHWLWSFLFIACFSSFGLLWVYGDNERYLGLSDVIHGWILLGTLSIITKEARLAMLVFILFWLKIIEENSGFHFFTSAELNPENIATQSHLFGAVGGMLYAFLFIKPFRHWLLSKLAIRKYDSSLN